MNPPGIKLARFLSAFFSLILLGGVVVSCSKTGHEEPPGKAEEAPAPEPSPAWQALALLEPGEYPLWFELGSDGPRLIDSPEEASLTPYNPWPFARYAAGMLLRGSTAVFAVNREGFLALDPRPEGILLSRIPGGPQWETCTIGAFFFYEDNPAVFLYRDDFFVDAPPLGEPGPRVFLLREEEPAPAAIFLPALETYPPQGGWETSALRQGPEGFWYYRQNRLQGSPPGSAYFRTPDLSLPGEEISLGAWRNSALPEASHTAPPALIPLLDAAFSLVRGDAPVAVIVTEEGARTFAGSGFTSPGEDGGILTLRGFFLDSSGKAGIIFPDGQGLYSEGGAPPEAFQLPSLPEGFCYTGLIPIGNAFAASWEEQQEAAVAAAGFMIQASVAYRR